MKDNFKFKEFGCYKSNSELIQMGFEPTAQIWLDAVAVELLETLWGTRAKENYLTE